MTSLSLKTGRACIAMASVVLLLVGGTLAAPISQTSDNHFGGAGSGVPIAAASSPSGQSPSRDVQRERMNKAFGMSSNNIGAGAALRGLASSDALQGKANPTADQGFNAGLPPCSAFSEFLVCEDILKYWRCGPPQTTPEAKDPDLYHRNFYHKPEFACDVGDHMTVTKKKCLQVVRMARRYFTKRAMQLDLQKEAKVAAKTLDSPPPDVRQNKELAKQEQFAAGGAGTTANMKNPNSDGVRSHIPTPSKENPPFDVENIISEESRVDAEDDDSGDDCGNSNGPGSDGKRCDNISRSAEHPLDLRKGRGCEYVDGANTVHSFKSCPEAVLCLNIVKLPTKCHLGKLKEPDCPGAIEWGHY